MRVKDKISNKLKLMGNEARDHIWIDSLALLELKQEYDEELNYTNVTAFTHIFGLKIIEVHDLESPTGKVDFIIGGTKYR